MTARGVRSLILGLLLVGGAVGFVRHELRRMEDAGLVAARGSFWHALDDQGGELRVRRGQNFRLEVGEIVELAAGADGRRIRRLDAALELHGTATFVDIELATSGPTYVLRVASSASFGVVLGQRDERGKFAPLSARADGVGLFERVDIRLEHDGRTLIGSIGGKPVVRVDVPATEVTAVSILGRGGRCVVHGLGVGGIDADGVTPFREHDDLQQLARASPIGEFGGALARVAAGVLLLLAFLRSLCRARPAPGLLLRALAVWLVPLLLWLIAVAAMPALPVPMPVVLVLLLIGFMPALFVLREPLREASAPSSPWPALVTVIACLGVGALLMARHEVARFDKAIAAERKAVGVAEPAPYELAAPVHLACDNALEIPSGYRNFELSARVKLGEGAILQARLRAPAIDQAEGVCLFVSADERFPSGFVEETHGDFVDLDRDAGAVAASRWLELQVRVDRRGFSATLDGRGLGDTSSRLFPRGSLVLLAAHGEVDVAALAVRPIAVAERAPGPLGDRLRAMAALVAFALLYSGTAAWLLRRAWLAVAWPTSIALLPAALCIGQALPSGEFAALELVTGLAAAGLALLLVPLALSRTLNAGGYLLITALVGVGAVSAFRHCAERAWPQRELELSRITPLDWHGERLEREFIHFQHPLYRRFNPYLVAHELRGRAVARDKRRGVIRIATLGTSSTYGYAARVPYGHRLEELLRKEGFDVEVMVAAWPGSSGSRQLDFLNHEILAFQPDILTVSLFYNDSYVLSQIDERTYVAQITEPGYHRSLLTDLRDRLRGAMAERTYRRLLSSGGDVEGGLSALVERPPPVIFEEILREFASIASRYELGLLFIKEPTAGVRPWRQAFYEVMDRVGADTGFPVADPSPVMDARGGRKLYVDIVHPNDEGHQVMAEILLPAVRRLVRQRTEGR